MILRQVEALSQGVSLLQACVFGFTLNALGTKALGVQVKMGDKLKKPLRTRRLCGEKISVFSVSSVRDMLLSAVVCVGLWLIILLLLPLACGEPACPEPAEGSNHLSPISEHRY